jgi:hypothetical protein
MFRKKYLSLNLLLLFFVVSFAFASTNNDIEERISKKETPIQILQDKYLERSTTDEDWKIQKEQMSLLIKNYEIDPNNLVKYGQLNLYGNHIEEKLKLLIGHGLDLNRISYLNAISSLSDAYFDELSKQEDKVCQLLLKLLLNSYANTPEEEKTSQARIKKLLESGVNPNTLVEHGWLNLYGNHKDEKLKLLIGHGLDLNRISYLNAISSLSDAYFDELSKQGDKVCQLLLKSLLNSYANTPEEEKTSQARIKKLLESGVNPNSIFKDGFLVNLSRHAIEEKLELLIKHGLDLSKLVQISNISSLSVDFIKKLLADKKITSKKFFELVAYDRKGKKLKKGDSKTYIVWLQEISKLINESYSKELINPSTLDTLLHLSIKNNDINSAEDLLFEFPELVNFANIDDETPMSMSYRLGNINGMGICAYFGALKLYDDVPCSEISNFFKDSLAWQKNVLQKAIFKAYNLNSSEKDTLFLIIAGAEIKRLIDPNNLIEPLLKNGVPTIIIGDGIAPISINAISAVLAEKYHAMVKFKKINVIVLAHGVDSKNYLTNYQDENSYHRVRLNSLFSEKTEDLFHIFNNILEERQKASIFMYSCYSGLALQDGQSVFKHRSNVQVVTLSKPNIPTSSNDSNMEFYSDPEKFSKELTDFPKSFINKYLINMYDENNAVGVYENGKIYFTDDLIKQIEEKYFLEYLDYQNEYKLSDKKLDIIRNFGLMNSIFLEEPIYDEEYQKVEQGDGEMDECVCFDERNSEFKVNTEMNTNNVRTAYAYCLEDSEDNAYCKRVFDKPEFGLLQYHALRYLQLCPDPA